MKRSTLQVVATVAALLPAAAVAQQPAPAALDTLGMRSGGVGIHALAGAFAGRLDFQGGGATHLLGARGGVGLGELVQLTGFYWRSFDREAGEFTADNGWGGELQLNLNAGLGVAPFVTGGVARVTLDNGMGSQTAAVAGAGVQLPLGPVVFQAGVRDYMFGVTGLRDGNSPEDVTHNWKFSAGVMLGFGRGRPQQAVVAARPDAAIELAMLRDSLALAAQAQQAAAARLAAGDTGAFPVAPPEALPGGTPAPPVATVRDTSAVLRNYQSDQRIEIPLPTWGSITLRYGPEPDQAPQPPIIIQAAPPGAAPPAGAPPSGAAAGTAAAQQAPGAQAPGVAQAPAPAPVPLQPQGAAAAPQQPTFILPPQQQLAPQPFGQEATGFTQGQLDAVPQRVLDGLRFTLLPQLDAAQAQRMNALREDLRRELTRIEAVAAGTAAPGTVPGAAPAAAALTPPPPPAVTPSVAGATPELRPEGTPVAPPAVPSPEAADLLAQVRAAAAAELAAVERERTLRQGAGEIATRHGALLSPAETERGPALVLSDAAFTPDGLSVGPAARTALSEVAALAQSHPGHVYVQAHVDAGRTELASQRLSELRAEAVRSLLVLAGVAQDRIHAVGYGHARPAASSATPAGRAANRRVEIVMGRE